MLSCVKESRPAPFTIILDDNPGMLMFISLVVREPHETALVTVVVEAITAPPEATDDAISGPQAMSPCNVVFVWLRVIRSEAFNWI